MSSYYLSDFAKRELDDIWDYYSKMLVSRKLIAELPIYRTTLSY